MAEKEERKPLPPYIPYKTFKGVIKKLKESTIPDQIDLSVLRSYSNSMARQIIAALKYLKLIDSFGKPSEHLDGLVIAYDDPTAWRDSLGDILANGYNSIIGNLNIDTATARQLDEKFRDAGADGQMLQKCVGFYVAAYADAGLTISPHITNKPRKPRKNGRGRPKKTDDNGESETPLYFKPDVGQPTGNLVKFMFPIPEKGTATILIPGNVTAEDWEMISTMMDAYVARFEKKRD